MKPALRTPLLTFHLWTGITVGLVFVVVALSGTALIFRTALERKLDAKRFIVEPGAKKLPPDELVARAKAAHPGVDFLSVRYWSDPTAPFLAYFADKNYVHLNPYTGEVLGVRARYGEGFGWIEGLHKYLTLEPDLGEKVNSAFGMIFAALTLTGVVLWWPVTRRALKAGLTLNWKLAGRPWNLNLHKTVGFYVALVLLFSAGTGVFIGLDSTRAVLDWITFSKRDEAPVAPEGVKAKFTGFNDASARMEALMPHAIETYIPLPKKGVVAAYSIAADAPQPNARSYAYLTTTAEVIRLTRFADAPAGYRLYYWLLSLHTAVAGGPLMQLVLFLASLSVPLLAWTGVASYLKRKSRARAASAAPVLHPEPASAK